MWCRVITTLTVLSCITTVGHSHTHLASDESKIPPPSLTDDDDDERASFDGNDERWNVSHASPVKDDTLEDDDVTPRVPFDEAVFPDDHHPVTITPPLKVHTTITQDEMIITPIENISVTTTHNDITITTSFLENINSTHETSISTTSTHLRNSTNSDQQVTTEIHTHEEDTTTTTTTTSLETDITISLQQQDTVQSLRSRVRGKTTVLDPVLVDGQVPLRVDQIVVCSCPVMTPDGCRRFFSDIAIESKDQEYQNVWTPLEDLNVVVHNVTCLKKDHRLMNFSEGQFYYRDRGDLVLTDAGYLAGLRVSDYCADLRRDNKLTVKICVAPPSVPRCCPYGQALKDGVCTSANTPATLTPPLSAGLDENPIYWPVIKNHYHPLNCTENPLRSIPLVSFQSYLLSTPAGLVHIWNPVDGHVSRKLTFPPDMCVDGYVDTYGSVVYSANICYTHPEEHHRKVCDDHVCVRKCCPYGEEMSLTVYRCVPSNSTSYEIQFTSNPYDYKVVIGKPLCEHQTVVENATVDSRGRFNFYDTFLSATDYCVDKFSDWRGVFEDKSLVCIREPNRGWVKARRVVFPVCQAISVFFLFLTVCCYCTVPRLLQGGGWYHLFHVLSLMLGYSTMISQKMLSDTWERTTCFIMGILLQFAFLATFFWLNILCFDVWRKVRSLNKYRSSSPIPLWVYVLYGYGVPVAIGILTVCMHFFAPDDVPGLVKPNLAKSRCFFPNPLALLFYFYGPIAFLFALNVIFIAHTYWICRHFEINSSKLREKSQDEANTTNKMNTEQIHRKRDYVADFIQQFSLLVLMAVCWISEILSWQIPPIELWALTDILNTLQGFFIFLIFLANRSKRKCLKVKFPRLFKMANQVRSALCCCCQSDNKSWANISKKLSTSSIASTLSTLSTNLALSTTSLSVNLPSKHDLKRSYVFEGHDGITILSLSKTESISMKENSATLC